MGKIYGYCAVVLAFVCLVLCCYVLGKSLKAVKEENVKLQRTLSANLQATKDKEERTQDELKRLQETTRVLHQLNNACLSSDVTDDLVEFLQYLQQQYPSTISITFAK